MGVNDRIQLAEAEARYQAAQKLKAKHTSL